MFKFYVYTQKIYPFTQFYYPHKNCWCTLTHNTFFTHLNLIFSIRTYYVFPLDLNSLSQYLVMGTYVRQPSINIFMQQKSSINPVTKEGPNRIQALVGLKLVEYQQSLLSTHENYHGTACVQSQYFCCCVLWN